jgi:hypothetical protein
VHTQASGIVKDPSSTAAAGSGISLKFVLLVPVLRPHCVWFIGGFFRGTLTSCVISMQGLG